jgi:NADPH-dependent 2,4-dienoyl-CoA reductase/sulfur reductase-like enzyme
VRDGMEVSLIEGADRVALAYGPEVAERVEAELGKHGVRRIRARWSRRFWGKGAYAREVRRHRAGHGPGDRRRRHKTLRRSGRGGGTEIGATGAIRVDEHMKTNLPDVWAAGDCVETTNLVSGKPVWVPLGDTANQMGRVAGTNATSSAGTTTWSSPVSSAPASSRSSTSGLARPASPNARHKVPASRS